jgi:deoxyribose-phosphate aldolase
MNKKELAKYIDHTLLKPETTLGDIKKLCAEAVEYGFYSVCVNPVWVAKSADILSGEDVKVCSVAGFPLGADTIKIKRLQTKEVINAGADEVDMVADISAIVSLDRKKLRTDIGPVLYECERYRPRVPLKVIIESAVLTDEQIIFVCEICRGLGVDFIKTATGLHPAGGATIQDVRLMKSHSGNCKVKAAGGISTAAQAVEFINAGVERLGCSKSVQIISELE